MYDFPIGVLLESFKCDYKTALKKAADVGVKAVQISATSGDMDARTITSSMKKDILDIAKSNGLKISAICGDFICGNPEYSFAKKEQQAEIIERSKRILDLSLELETNIVTTHVGVIPTDHQSDKFKLMQETCHNLSVYAQGLNAYFAIETGPEIATTLKAFLDSLGAKGVGVNLDPANFVMVTGDDPVKAVHTLKEYIAHTHAKDGKRLIVGEPEVIYGEIETQIVEAKYFTELPLGEGDVDFSRYLAALNDIGYTGYLTIEREVGADPMSDIKKAVEFLNNLKMQG